MNHHQPELLDSPRISTGPISATIGVRFRPLGQGRFAAMFAGRELCRSRTPLLTAARVLLEEGWSPDCPLHGSHEGSPIVALRSTIGAAARLTVWEPDREGISFEAWSPYAGSVSRSERAIHAHNIVGGSETALRPAQAKGRGVV
jgi:hypothetical protein